MFLLFLLSMGLWRWYGERFKWHWIYLDSYLFNGMILGRFEELEMRFFQWWWGFRSLKTRNWVNLRSLQCERGVPRTWRREKPEIFRVFTPRTSQKSLWTIQNTKFEEIRHFFNFEREFQQNTSLLQALRNFWTKPRRIWSVLTFLNT